MLNRADLGSIHRYSAHHRELVERSERAACFYREQVFSPSKVTDWIDGEQTETGDTTNGVTALCPRCGIDAVLPSDAPVPFTSDMLAQMHAH